MTDHSHVCAGLEFRVVVGQRPTQRPTRAHPSTPGPRKTSWIAQLARAFAHFSTMLASQHLVVAAQAGSRSARGQARPAAAPYVRPLGQLRGARGAQLLASTSSSNGRRAVRSQTVRVSAIFGGLQKLIKGDPSEKTRDKYQSTVARINSFAAATAELTDDQLRAKTEQFKTALANGATLDSVLPEAFAVSCHIWPHIRYFHRVLTRSPGLEVVSCSCACRQPGAQAGPQARQLVAI